MKKVNVKQVALVVALVLVFAAVAYVYTIANHNNTCPVCGGELHYDSKIFKAGNGIWYRYICNDNPLHFVDTLTKIEK